jgi:hypothetical protein
MVEQGMPRQILSRAGHCSSRREGVATNQQSTKPGYMKNDTFYMQTDAGIFVPANQSAPLLKVPSVEIVTPEQFNKDERHLLKKLLGRNQPIIIVPR